MAVTVSVRFFPLPRKSRLHYNLQMLCCKIFVLNIFVGRQKFHTTKISYNENFLIYSILVIGECTRDLLQKRQVERLHASSAINSVVYKTCGTLTSLLCNVIGDFKFKIHPVAC